MPKVDGCKQCESTTWHRFSTWHLVSTWHPVATLRRGAVVWVVSPYLYDSTWQVSIKIAGVSELSTDRCHPD